VKEREPIKSAAGVFVPVSAMTVPVVELKELHVNEKQLLGKGSFGQVCKGNYLGTDLAVKKITIERLSMSMAFVNKEVCG
jgi:predicted Ser/Thr protein kinase